MCKYFRKCVFRRFSVCNMFLLKYYLYFAAGLFLLKVVPTIRVRKVTSSFNITPRGCRQKHCFHWSWLCTRVLAPYLSFNAPYSNLYLHVRRLDMYKHGQSTITVIKLFKKDKRITLCKFVIIYLKATFGTVFGPIRPTMVRIILHLFPSIPADRTICSNWEMTIVW